MLNELVDTADVLLSAHMENRIVQQKFKPRQFLQITSAKSLCIISSQKFIGEISKLSCRLVPVLTMH